MPAIRQPLPSCSSFATIGAASEQFDDWCSNANFFENREVAASWLAQRQLHGEVIELDGRQSR